MRRKITTGEKHLGAAERTDGWWACLWGSKGLVLLLAGFLILFLSLLLHVPLSGSLLGTTDSLFIPALADTYLNRIQSLLTGEFFGQAMYPADIMRFGESYVGLLGVFMLFRAAGASDVYSLYFTQALMFSFMGVSATLFASNYTQRPLLALFVGLTFSTSGFIAANVDDLYTFAYGFPLLSAHLLKSALVQKNGRLLAWAALVAGVQAYFSMQLLIYELMILGVILLVNVSEFRRAFPLRAWGIALGAFAIAALPRIIFYVYTISALKVVDFWPISEQAFCYYLQPFDFFVSALPDKLITYGFVQTYQNVGRFSDFCGIRQLAFMGLGMPALALVGLFRPRKPQLEMLSIALLGLIFALGGIVKIGDRAFVSPLELFYRYFPLGTYLRVGLRSYALCVLAVSMLAMIGLGRIWDFLSKYRRWMPGAAFLVSLIYVLAENISWPLNRLEVYPYPEIPAGYAEYFQDKPDALILDLPSLSAGWPGYMDEIRYVLWQTRHKRNTISGVTGYYPPTRARAQRRADLLPAPEAFAYFQQIGVTHFVWHDSPHIYSHPPGSFITYGPTDTNIIRLVARDFTWLEDSPYLERVFKNDVLTIYELLPAENSASAEGDG